MKPVEINRSTEKILAQGKEALVELLGDDAQALAMIEVLGEVTQWCADWKIPRDAYNELLDIVTCHAFEDVKKIN